MFNRENLLILFLSKNIYNGKNTIDKNYLLTNQPYKRLGLQRGIFMKSKLKIFLLAGLCVLILNIIVNCDDDETSELKIDPEEEKTVKQKCQTLVDSFTIVSSSCPNSNSDNQNNNENSNSNSSNSNQDNFKKLMQNETWRDIWSGLWITEVEAVFGCDNASHIIAAYDECVDWINTNWIDSDDCEIDFELPSSCQDIIFTINDKVDDNIED